MTWLINVDNGGTTTGFCLVDGGEVRYTKTLATPYDLSRCLSDGRAKVSELAYGRPRLAALPQSTDCIRCSTSRARRLVIAASGADGQARAKGCTLVICSTRSCTRPLSVSCSTPTGGCGTPGPASRRGSSGGG